MKRFKLFNISIFLILVAVAISLTGCQFVSFGGNFADILDSAFKTTVTYYDKDPSLNPDALKIERKYKIGSKYNSININKSELKEFKNTHVGQQVKGWIYLCNAIDTSVTAVPEGINIDVNGYISSITIPVDPFWVYADWEEAIYTITYHLQPNGESQLAEWKSGFTPVTSRKYSVPLVLPTDSNISRSGYTFDGWYTDSSYTTKITQILANDDNDYDLYAKWNKNTYYFTYHDWQGGQTLTDGKPFSGDTTSVENQLDFGDKLKKPSPKGAAGKTSIEFEGWYKDAGCTAANKITSTVIDASVVGDAADGTTIHLFAKWKYKYIYVKPGSGNDGATGISPGSAVKTLGEAKNYIDSTYTEKIILCSTLSIYSQTDADWINGISSLGKDGKLQIQRGEFDGTLISSRGSGVKLENLIINNDSITSTFKGTGIEILASTNLTINNIIVYNTSGENSIDNKGILYLDGKCSLGKIYLDQGVADNGLLYPGSVESVSGNAYVGTISCSITPTGAYNPVQTGTYVTIMKGVAETYDINTYFAPTSSVYAIRKSTSYESGTTTYTAFMCVSDDPVDSGGTISGAFYENITVSLSITEVYSNGPNHNTISFKDKKGNSITVDVLSITLWSDGVEISSPTYFTADENNKEFIINAGIPAGTNLRVKIKFKYHGINYEEDFDFIVLESSP